MSKGPLYLEQPLDIDEARLAARRLAEQRRTAEAELQAQSVKAADAEADYRKRYALEFVQAEGTAAEREAIARSEAHKESRQRDIDERMVKILHEKLRGLEGERSILKSLIDWSARAVTTTGSMPEPQWTGR